MSDLHSLVGPYITDALEVDERDSFELHLDSCVECRTEVLELQETMAEMSAFHETAPPPELRSFIMSAISSTPMLPADDSATVHTPSPDETSARDATPEHDMTPSNVVTPDFTRSRRPVVTWLAAAAAVLAVALGGVTVWQQSELQSIQAADAQRVELLAAPDLQVSRTNLDDTDLTYLVSQSRGEAIIASTGLPTPGAERSWQVWVIQDEVPRSVGIVDDGGQLQVSVAGITGGELMAITNEPRGGSPAPTGEIQAAVELKTA